MIYHERDDKNMTKGALYVTEILSFLLFIYWDKN